ncbi:MAG TPA: hypothetical protein DC058_21305 [Planctomycetaceae bacterium]|nr:hypothetical protein [Planctomycetaceae bacterium]
MHSEFGRIVKGTWRISGGIRTVSVNNKVRSRPEFFEILGNVLKWERPGSRCCRSECFGICGHDLW